MSIGEDLGADRRRELRARRFWGTAASIGVTMSISIGFMISRANLGVLSPLEVARRLAVVSAIVLACSLLAGLVTLIRWPWSR